MLIPASAMWFGEAIAAAAVLVVSWRLWRRFKTIPKRVPLGFRFDGRPRRAGARAALWLGPAAVAAIVAVSATVIALRPPAEYERATVALTFVLLAEVTWFVSWTIDRSVEIARGMTHRIAPMRMLTTLLPLLFTVLVILAVTAGELL